MAVPGTAVLPIGTGEGPGNGGCTGLSGRVSAHCSRYVHRGDAGGPKSSGELEKLFPATLYESVKKEVMLSVY